MKSSTLETSTLLLRIGTISWQWLGGCIIMRSADIFRTHVVTMSDLLQLEILLDRSSEFPKNVKPRIINAFVSLMRKEMDPDVLRRIVQRLGCLLRDDSPDVSPTEAVQGKFLLYSFINFNRACIALALLFFRTAEHHQFRFQSARHFVKPDLSTFASSKNDSIVTESEFIHADEAVLRQRHSFERFERVASSILSALVYRCDAHSAADFVKLLF